MAVNRYSDAIRFIKNPSEKVQLEAVKISGNSIQYLVKKLPSGVNPSEKVQLAAVKQNGNAIQYLTKPSEKVQLAARFIFFINFKTLF